MTAQEFQQFWQASGLTQKQLAEALGCSQSAISEWKDGKREVPKKVVIIIELMQKVKQDGNRSEENQVDATSKTGVES